MRVMIDIPNNARRMVNLRFRHGISRFLMLSALVCATLGILPVSAQLTQNCGVSILNRTAEVQPDGSWRIDNVPANSNSTIARTSRWCAILISERSCSAQKCASGMTIRFRITSMDDDIFEVSVETGILNLRRIFIRNDKLIQLLIVREPIFR